jgi:hypothetical protein
MTSYRPLLRKIWLPLFFGAMGLFVVLSRSSLFSVVAGWFVVAIGAFSGVLVISFRVDIEDEVVRIRRPWGWRDFVAGDAAVTKISIPMFPSGSTYSLNLKDSSGQAGIPLSVFSNHDAQGMETAIRKALYSE